MNGRQAISLTSEPNLICQTDYTKDIEDVCPKKEFERPAPKPCCVKEKQSRVLMMHCFLHFLLDY